MAKGLLNSKLSPAPNNSDILVSDEHEQKEVKKVDRVVSFKELDPEICGLVEYTEKTFSNVCLVPLYDLHIGGEGMRLDRLKKIIDFIKSIPNVKVLLGGDIFDNATLNGATNAHTSKTNPDRALDLAEALFKPIADKILCILPGNHDGTSGERNRDSNMSQAKQFAKRLNVKFFPYNVLIKMNLPVKGSKNNSKNTIAHYTYATHGSGSIGVKAGAIDTALKKAMNICGYLKVSPDLILVGHHHADVDGAIEVKVPNYNEKGQQIGEIEKTVRVASLSSMQEANSYALANGMELYTSNMHGINICWLKNPYFSDANKENEYEFLAQTTKFPILKTSSNAYTKIAEQYKAAYSLGENFKETVKDTYSSYSISELEEEIQKI